MSPFQCIISVGAGCSSFVTGDVSFAHLVKVVCVSFLHCEITVFSIVIPYLG